MRLRLCLLLWVALSALTARASEPFAIVLPRDFSAPMVSSFGADRRVAYIRPTDDSKTRCLFEVTITPITESEKSDTLEVRLDRLLRGFSGRRKGFTKTNYAKTTLGGLEALTVDWEGETKGLPMKGRVICAVHGGNCVYVAFEDTPNSWDKTVAELTKALTTFKLQQNS